MVMAGNQNQDIAVLFVCLGNICRSPMAEGALREAARKAGLDIRVDSVGTADYHVGERPDPRAVAIAQSHGVDISGVIGRQLSDEDFDNFSHIYALDKANLAGINARRPRHGRAEIGLMLDVLDHRRGEAVPDPYYGNDEDFEKCWQTISEAVSALVPILAVQKDRANI